MNIMQKLFLEFDNSNIKYLSFKSNINLSKNFEGKADFDVLVDSTRISEVESIILKNNGKRFNPRLYGRYPGVDNWLIFDEEFGIIFHLHLHYQIATGKQLLKEYVIPWNECLFNSRIYDEKWNIYIANPNVELLLLTVRCIVKSRISDNLKSFFGLYRLHDSLKKERDYLISVCNYDDVDKYINELFEFDYHNTIKRIVRKKDISSSDFRKLSKSIRLQLNNFRRYSGFVATFKSGIYRLNDLKNKFFNRKIGAFNIVKKVSDRDGLIIAFVGTDGAGKSTVTTDITTWLSKKIESKKLYMGMGDGKTTIFNSTMKKINQIDNNLDKKQYVTNDINKISFIGNPKLYLKKYIKMKTILNVEKNNAKKLKKILKYKLNGGITILDRFPQIEVSGQNDGPKIELYKKYFGNKHFYKVAVKKESNYLSIVKVIKPDIIFRLNISPKKTVERKPEIGDVSFAKKKIDDLKKITYQNANIYDIDTEQDYNSELLEIKRIIWRTL